MGGNVAPYRHLHQSVSRSKDDSRDSELLPSGFFPLSGLFQLELLLCRLLELLFAGAAFCCSCALSFFPPARFYLFIYLLQEVASEVRRRGVFIYEVCGWLGFRLNAEIEIGLHRPFLCGCRWRLCGKVFRLRTRK